MFCNDCKDSIKAFGAIYKDGLSLNTDRKVKTSETPISILEESDIQYQKGDHAPHVQVGMVVKSKYGHSVLLQEVLALSTYQHPTYGRFVGKGLVVERNLCSKCVPFTIKHPRPVAVFEDEIEKIEAVQIPIERLHKCGERVVVENNKGEVFEALIEQIDFNDKQFRYMVELDGVKVWCAESKSECSLDGLRCNDFWVLSE